MTCSARSFVGSVFPCFGYGMELPVGTERIGMMKKKGKPEKYFVMVKISRKKLKKGTQFNRYSGTWRLKKELLWEKNYGRIPKGYLVIFLDGNEFNFEIDNLALATKNEICLLHHYGLQFNDKEHTKAGLAVVRHRAAIGRLMKQTHNTYTMPKQKKSKE
jgi:hypothetical protein